MIAVASLSYQATVAHPIQSSIKAMLLLRIDMGKLAPQPMASLQFHW
jgi:hypothetical protein